MRDEGSATAERGVEVQGLASRIDAARQIVIFWPKTFAALALASFVVFCAAAWPFTRAHLQAVAVLRLVAGQPVPRLIARAVTEPVTTEEITFPSAAGAIRAR